MEDIEDIGSKIVAIVPVFQSKIPKPIKEINPQDIPSLKELINAFISEISEQNNVTKDMWDKHKRMYMRTLSKKKKAFKGNYRNLDYRYIYSLMVESGECQRSTQFENVCKTCEVRENSGVLVFTLVMSPYPEYVDENGNIVKQAFTCQYDCYYCPKFPGMPRSYIPDEPAVARAIQNDWDPIRQFLDRAIQYKVIGMNCESGIKAEVILEGGTHNSYPEEYRRKFIRSIFYAANTLNDSEPKRPMMSMEQEQFINQTAFCKIIGISVETRPDCISPDYLVELRECGVTRVQLGVQHTNDEILHKVNRGCYVEHTVQAIKLLKDCAFKVQIHLMPDLPNSNPDLDREMFDRIVNDPDLQADSIKVYPVMVTPHTIIKQWYDKGTYFPYTEDVEETVFTPDGKSIQVNQLVLVVAYFKAKVPEWVRLERVIRDIPKTARDKQQIIVGGCSTTNLRQEIEKHMKVMGTSCRCIRCREVGSDKIHPDYRFIIRPYSSSGSVDFFLSFESPDLKTIYGLCRLRISLDPIQHNPVFSELNGCALIRELHVYGKMTSTGLSGTDTTSQHFGFGSKLLNAAEMIAAHFGHQKIAVISGVGVRTYYHKRGYTDGNLYQIKQISRSDQITSIDPKIITVINKAPCHVDMSFLQPHHVNLLIDFVDPNIDHSQQTNQINLRISSICDDQLTKIMDSIPSQIQQTDPIDNADPLIKTVITYILCCWIFYLFQLFLIKMYYFF